ncbi:30S ribosome-binding factor RbfA [Pediococcus pentosaceus]|jgi:ribosome-binding factor A|uniref:Ribosome-binding factor A n=3 Tax=Pediococcus pentosaceus TaxID=1255 RepID=RBFA_PEDPA|nr:MULTISPECIES: 30S ribosome-binding factor RbfA [Pediococcus]Q03FS2.1 RecName: Full=Ribosome-binding factor A [Pediococcus pentosaceus ATCC 25745]ABJ67950.1 ribosome-binding factor A [Pediococcus pentosaceus ATCC 25745]AHA05016.1 ribosome-binding factor A [Pediococcus pentosaceus SL4]ANI97958.1 ribosome-binding factor A [Pediococcus pentosaceus]ARW19840.1 Ribosome-binding factor [Pediococcus pentosaceus]ASC08555.1 Ribosome-binding factor [Pediococcus pentosaceus]
MARQYRSDRLSQEIEKEVSDILRRRVRDPRVEGVTITGVDVTGDLQQAKIYYSILSDKASDDQKTKAGLEKASGLIRKELGSRLSIYKTPELSFIRDESVQYGDKIDQLLNKLNRD